MVKDIVARRRLTQKGVMPVKKAISKLYSTENSCMVEYNIVGCSVVQYSVV